MRTTLNLSDALAREAKSRAREEGMTLTGFIEEALRDRLRRTVSPAVAEPLPTFGDPASSRFLVDLDDKDALMDVLDERA